MTGCKNSMRKISSYITCYECYLQKIPDAEKVNVLKYQDRIRNSERK